MPCLLSLGLFLPVWIQLAGGCWLAPCWLSYTLVYTFHSGRCRRHFSAVSGVLGFSYTRCHLVRFDRNIWPSFFACTYYVLWLAAIFLHSSIGWKTGSPATHCWAWGQMVYHTAVSFSFVTVLAVCGHRHSVLVQAMVGWIESSCWRECRLVLATCCLRGSISDRGELTGDLSQNLFFFMAFFTVKTIRSMNPLHWAN